MKNATPAQMRRGLRIHAIAFAWVFVGWGAGLLSHWLAVRGHLARDRGTGRSGGIKT
jgi:hypothetical protein